MRGVVKSSDRFRKIAVGVGIALCGSTGVIFDRERFLQFGPFRVIRAGFTVW